VPTDRRFCRFSRSPSTARFGMPEVPDDGLCLSAFVVLSSAEHPSQVLMGQLNPDAPWDHLGALDPERVAAWRDRWMLPASHLLVLESPEAAAVRILVELTGLGPRPLQGPQVGSEVYTPERHPSATHHWDLEFIFRGVASEAEIRPIPPWKELRFVETRTLGRGAMARSQDDVLRQAGFEVGPNGA
jgi:ADP-ribose pyrophosphatase YjhB (NUDIX family)